VQEQHRMQPSSARAIHAHRQAAGRSGDRDVLDGLQLVRRPLKSENAEVVLAHRVRRQVAHRRRRRRRPPIEQLTYLGGELDHMAGL
jgi:hypothetical protein